MSNRDERKKHNKEVLLILNSKYSRIVSTILYILYITYLPLKFLELLDLLALRAIKPAYLALVAQIGSKRPSLSIYLKRKERQLIKATLLLLEKALMLPLFIMELIDAFQGSLRKITPPLYLDLIQCLRRTSLLNNLTKKPMLKSAVAMSLILVFSIYSYALHSTLDPNSPVKPALLEHKFKALAPIEQLLVTTEALEATSKSISKAETNKEAPPTDIASFRDIFTSESLIHMSRGKLDLREVSITFDGGEANHAKEILSVLRSKEIQTTIFLTGRFIRKNPEIVREILADGHEVGNHTLSHPHLTDFDRTLVHTTLPKITKEYFLEQITTTADLFREVTGEEMAPFWRAPYGEINLELTQWAFEAGFIHIGWTADYKRRKSLDTLDWVKDKDSKNYLTANEIHKRILDFDTIEAGLKGGIILMHLGTNRRGDYAVSVLDDIIDDIRERGYSFVKISEMARGKFIATGKRTRELIALR
jgi:peptidoglycan/xylan/chitin deacetylase (PgdA/CDA1 family)